MKKLIAAVTTGLIAIALVVVGAAAPASAHTATFNGQSVCNTSTGGATITWTIDNDWDELVTVTNSSDQGVIPIGATVAAKTGKNDTTSTFTQDVPAPAAGFSQSITLDFEWTGDNYKQGDTTATVTVDSSCAVKDASAAIIDTPATCGAGETVTEGAIANATWTTDTETSPYDLVATANAGHTFASASAGGHLNNAKTVETFTGTLQSATNPKKCKDASAALVFTAATCLSAQTVAEGAITDATWSPITYPTTSSYSAVATANSGFEFPSGAGVSNNNSVLTLTGDLNPQLSADSHPCEDFITVAWKMPGPWINSTTPTWHPYQTYFTSQETGTPELNVLDSQLTGTCGQYQVDIYYNSPTTTSLIAGGKLYGPNNPPEDLLNGGVDGWGIDYKLIDEPTCATPATPTETDSCGNGGTITITPTLGVVYYVNNVAVDTSGGTVQVPVTDGSNVVTAVAETGYQLQGYPADGWTFDINTDCTASFDSSGTCTVVNDTSFEDISLTFDNPSSTDATFEVTSPDSTVTDYPVAAGTSETEDVGPVSSAGGTFEVSINGGPATDIVVDSFTGCIPQVVPVTPTATPVTTCDVTGGSIDITPTAGIDYYIGNTQVTSGVNWVDQAATTGLTGKVHVHAVAENGFQITQGDRSHWHFWLGEATTCTVNLQAPVCSATNGGFYSPVILTFDNPAKDGADVVVTGGSISGQVEFTVPAGATDWPYTVDANGQSGDVYTVTINGAVQPDIDLNFDACPNTVFPSDPTVQDTTCTQATQGVPSVLVGGSITTDGNPELTYTLWTVVGGNPTNPQVFPGEPSPEISGLPGGQYLVTVASNNPDYVLGTPTDFPFTVSLTDRDCGGTTLTPVVTSDNTCAATGIIPPVDPTSGKFQAAITYVDGGVINLPQQPGILIFKINGVEQDASAVTEPNGGPYVVTVFLTDAAIADGYVLTDPNVSWTYSFDSFCPPTEATWNAGATGTNAVCTATSATDGVITLEHDANQDGKVTYTVTDDATSAVVYQGTNSVSTPGDTLVKVGAGHYTVVAVATNSGDGLSGSTSPDGSETFHIDVTLTGSDCDGNLAFTGGTIAWLGFVLAGGMLFLGFALLYMRRRGNRTAE